MFVKPIPYQFCECVAEESASKHQLRPRYMAGYFRAVKIAAIIARILLIPSATRAGDEEDVMKWIKSVGGRCRVTENLGTFQVGLEKAKITEDDLRKLLKLEVLDSLSLNGNPTITDRGMKHVGALTGLEHLTLSNTKVTDLGLKELGRLQALGSIYLNNTQVTDAGLRSLPGKKMQVLGLKGTQVTGLGLAHFAEVEIIDLSSSQATDFGLKSLPRLEKLGFLDLSDNPLVTDEATKEIAQCQALDDLAMAGCPITDIGMKRIGRLQNLHRINIADCNVTNQGLRELVNCKKMRTLDLARCPFHKSLATTG